MARLATDSILHYLQVDIFEKGLYGISNQGQEENGSRLYFVRLFARILMEVPC